MTERTRLALFVATSGLAALVNVLARIALDWVMVYEAAIVLAYLAGMAVAFVLGRVFVFDGRGGGWRGQSVRFAIVNALSAAQVLAVSLLLSRLVFPAIGMTFRPELVAHMMGVASPVLTSFWLHRHFTFRKPGLTA